MTQCKHDPVWVIEMPAPANAFCYDCGFFPLPLADARPVHDADLNRDHPIVVGMRRYAYETPTFVTDRKQAR